MVNMVEALNMALAGEMARDSNVVIMGEDVGVDGGVFRVSAGLYGMFGPERVMDMPLAESGIVGMAIGMSAFGLVPVAEIQFMGFLYPAFDQLISNASRIRARSRGRYGCPMVVRTPYGGGIKAIELHSESAEAAFCHIPGLKVVVPSSPYTAKGLLAAAIRDPDPVLFLEPTRLYRLIKEEVPEEPFTIPLGKARLLKEGRDATLISWGSMLQKTLKAAGAYDVDVIDLMTLSPYDEDAVLASVKKTGRAVIIQEAPRNCGFASEVAACIAEKAILSLRAPVTRVAGYDVVLPFPKLEDFYIPNQRRITDAIEEVLKY
ncbi:MAG: alpha-ketoacid dehydrogenase subunit beta [Actinomycetota bacterium]|nr:alpha-ketoacid dehydrogenase subunit beta [Actinomycetota bacterium]